MEWNEATCIQQGQGLGRRALDERWNDSVVCKGGGGGVEEAMYLEVLHVW